MLMAARQQVIDHLVKIFTITGAREVVDPSEGDREVHSDSSNRMQEAVEVVRLTPDRQVPVDARDRDSLMARRERNTAPSTRSPERDRDLGVWMADRRAPGFTEPTSRPNIRHTDPPSHFRT